MQHYLTPHPVCHLANGHSAQPSCLGPSTSVPLRLCPGSLQYSRTHVNTYSLCPNSTQSLCLAEGRHGARRLLCTFNKQLSHRAPWGCSWGEDTVGWGVPPWVRVPEAESGCGAHTGRAFGMGGRIGEGSRRTPRDPGALLRVPSPPDSGGPTWRPGPDRKGDLRDGSRWPRAAWTRQPQCPLSYLEPNGIF